MSRMWYRSLRVTTGSPVQGQWALEQKSGPVLWTETPAGREGGGKNEKRCARYKPSVRGNRRTAAEKKLGESQMTAGKQLLCRGKSVGTRAGKRADTER